MIFLLEVKFIFMQNKYLLSFDSSNMVAMKTLYINFPFKTQATFTTEVPSLTDFFSQNWNNSSEAFVVRNKRNQASAERIFKEK